MKGGELGVELFAGCLGFPLSSRSPPDAATIDELTGVNELAGLVLVIDDDVELEHDQDVVNKLVLIVSLESVRLRSGLIGAQPSCHRHQRLPLPPHPVRRSVPLRS